MKNLSDTSFEYDILTGMNMGHFTKQRQQAHKPKLLQSASPSQSRCAKLRSSQEKDSRLCMTGPSSTHLQGSVMSIPRKRIVYSHMSSQKSKRSSSRVNQLDSKSIRSSSLNSQDASDQPSLPNIHIELTTPTESQHLQPQQVIQSKRLPKFSKINLVPDTSVNNLRKVHVQIRPQST